MRPAGVFLLVGAAPVVFSSAKSGRWVLPGQRVEPANQRGAGWLAALLGAARIGEGSLVCSFHYRRGGGFSWEREVSGPPSAGSWRVSAVLGGLRARSVANRSCW